MSGIPDSVVIADQRAAIEALRDELRDWQEAHRIAVNDLGATDEIHCSCVPFLRIEINRLKGLLQSAGIDTNRPDNRLK